jgi:hypothetical protein
MGGTSNPKVNVAVDVRTAKQRRMEEPEESRMGDAATDGRHERDPDGSHRTPASGRLHASSAGW